MLAWIGDVRPGNMTIWVVVDVESESEVQNAQLLCLDQQIIGKTTPI